MNNQKTVLVTGASGFLAKHIVLQLLERGYRVRGSVRSEHRETEVRDILLERLPEGFDFDANLEFVSLDLSSDQGWHEALNGVDVLFHTASPFLTKKPKDDNELIRPAVDGTLRALEAANAAGIKRVVLTSSVAAISAPMVLDSDHIFSEKDWTDVNSKIASAYIKSKTLAEKAAWDFVEKNSDMQLTTINPGLILGPALDQNYGASLDLVERLLRGSDIAMPDIGFSVVDVRDVALMHILALETPSSIGERIISVAEGWVPIQDITSALHNAFPHRKIPMRTAPSWLVGIMSIFDSSIRQVLPTLGMKQEVSNARSKELLDISYRDWKDSLIDSATPIDQNMG